MIFKKYYSNLYVQGVSLESENKYNIIECLVHKIITSITNEFKVVDCKVVKLKPDAPIN